MIDPQMRHEDIDSIIMDGMNNLRSAGNEMDVPEIVIQSAEESLIALGAWTKFSRTCKAAGADDEDIEMLHLLYKMMMAASDKMAKKLTGDEDDS